MTTKTTSKARFFLNRLREFHPVLKLCKEPKDAEALHGILTSRLSLQDFLNGTDLNDRQSFGSLIAAHVARSLKT